MVGTSRGPYVTSHTAFIYGCIPFVHLVCWGGWEDVRLLALVGVVLL